MWGREVSDFFFGSKAIIINNQTCAGIGGKNCDAEKHCFEEISKFLATKSLAYLEPILTNLAHACSSHVINNNLRYPLWDSRNGENPRQEQGSRNDESIAWTRDNSPKENYHEWPSEWTSKVVHSQCSSAFQTTWSRKSVSWNSTKAKPAAILQGSMGRPESAGASPTYVSC